MPIVSIADLREHARRRLPRMVFDYIDGGADDEITLRRNTERFLGHELLWDVLRDVSTIDTSANVLGQAVSAPIIMAPTASSRLFNPRAGERAVARAAHTHGLLYSVSTLASTSIETIAQETPGPKVFQIYVWKDRGLVREILQRAKAAGFVAIVLTVDTPVAGNRERDPRNHFSIPPKVSAHTAAQALVRPGYLFDLATTPPIRAENFAHIAGGVGSIVDFINTQFDRTVTWRDAAWMREQWDGAFAIKGVGRPSDAAQCIDLGADAVWVSNHGGRQLDTAPATIDLLKPIADAVAGRGQIILDGGIRRGSDIAKALALGANAVAIGRPYLWGLAALGEAGVNRALDILTSELQRTMALLGRSRIAALGLDIVADVQDADTRSRHLDR
ncbi:MAG: alpha-hydroxy-acid oxidizing protein [Hyphomonadaceae bacterium]|nr:alpha-hydroxy-acid oxidizing protein [Hyphomonadaceae bacterium]